MSSITSIFHPLLAILADIVAFFYGLVHDYSVAIALLTILVYLALTPLLVKQTRSMIQMQKLQPEIRKLQKKYKGRDLESKQKLQEEMMALYKEHGVNPMGGCLPMIVQLPVLFVMYAVIRGLLNLETYKTKAGAVKDVIVGGHKVADPKYISHSSALYHNLVAAHGKMQSFGVDLAQAAGQHHSSFGAALPYYVLVVGAALLSLMQIQQMTIRNRKIMEQTSQMKQMQRMQYVTPLVMTFIYWKLPVALSVYFIVSSFFRIAQQELMYRFDPVLVAHVDAALARQPGTGGGRKEPAAPKAPSKAGGTKAGESDGAEESDEDDTAGGSPSGNGAGGTGGAKAAGAKPAGSGAAGTKPGGAKPAGKRPGTTGGQARPPARPGAKSQAGGARRGPAKTGGGQGGSAGKDSDGPSETDATGGDGDGEDTRSPGGWRGLLSAGRGTAAGRGSAGTENGTGEADGASGTRPHPRSKAKKPRKSR